jgi:(E)-4-hydroxy-3-methylbut-2-enyl-diphosphate synthase
MCPIINLCREIDEVLLKYNKKIKVAVMGCVVNGIGEGKGADLGFACSSLNTFTIFEHGQIKGTCKAHEVITYLIKFLEAK